MNFADPKNDVAFKKIFGDENKKEILLSFLDTILGFGAGAEKSSSNLSASPTEKSKINA